MLWFHSSRKAQHDAAARSTRSGRALDELLERLTSPRSLLEAYKRQTKIEKRFARLKSDFQFAPAFLKSPERIVGLLTAYTTLGIVRRW